MPEDYFGERVAARYDESEGAMFEPAQLLAPHRSNTQTLPRASTSTALVDPHVLSSFAHPCSDEYEVCSSGAAGARIVSAHPQIIATAAQAVTIVRDPGSRDFIRRGGTSPFSRATSSSTRTKLLLRQLSR